MQEQRTAALASQLVQAELRALRMQLQPHFLFNTLHAITVLITEQPARARRMLVLLGDLLRSTLVADGEPEVPLARELEFARRYLEIEAVRFEERLAVQFEIPDALTAALVPNFVLQPLVENAVAHGVGRSTLPCTVRVSAMQEGQQLVLDVWNDGTLAPVPERTGVGLTTTRERLTRIYGSAGTCTLEQVDAGVRARVTMPFRRTANDR